jgi:hypothetical protein
MSKINTNSRQVTATKRARVKQNDGMLTPRQFRDVLYAQGIFGAHIDYVGKPDYNPEELIHHVSAGEPGVPYPKDPDHAPARTEKALPSKAASPAPIPAPALLPVTPKQVPTQPKYEPKIYKLGPIGDPISTDKPANARARVPEKRSMLPGPRAAAAMLEAIPVTPMTEPAISKPVTEPAKKYNSISCDLMPNFAKQRKDDPDFIGKMTLDGERLYVGAWENERKNDRQLAYKVKFSRDSRASNLLHRSHKVGYESFKEWIMYPPEAGAGKNFHSWLKGAANSLISHRFEVYTGRRITQRRAEVILRKVSRAAEADVVRPRTWEQDVLNTVASVFAQRGKEYNGDREDGDFDRGDIILNTDLMLQLAPTYSRAQAIAESPVAYYAHDDSEPNYCQEALSTLFMELQVYTDELTLVFVQLNDRGGMEFIQGAPMDGSDYPWVVPHLMHVKGGRTDGGKGHRSIKCNDAVATPCYGVIEFDWKSTEDNLQLKAFLDRLDAAEIAYKDAQAAIINHLRQYAPLVMVVDSAGKSLHAWFNIRGVTREDWLKFRDYAVSLGSDPGGSGLSQQFRTPDGHRSDKSGERQRILYFNHAAINGSLTPNPRHPAPQDDFLS